MMKRVDYNTSRMVDFNKLYAFLSEFIGTCQNDLIKNLFYTAASLEQLQLNIQDNKQASEFFFRKLKHCADHSDHYIELEKYIIYMDILLGKHYLPFNQYKINLLKVILRHTNEYFTSDEYCVIRHLLPRQLYTLEDIIYLGHQNIKENSEADVYFTCEIYLIEGQYKKAELLLEKIRMEGILLDYQEEYNAYQRKVKRQQWLKKPLQQPLFQHRFA